MIRQFIPRTESGEVLTVEERIVFTLDLSGNFKSLNAAGQRLLGYRGEEARRLNVSEMLSVQCARDICERVKHNSRYSFGTVFDIEIVSQDGRHVRLETSLDLVRRADGLVEFEGIALPQGNAADLVSDRPRCLDDGFEFVEISS